MKTPIINSGAIAGIVAGLGYIVQSIMGLIKPQTEIFSGISDYILEVIFIIALIATIFAFMRLHAFSEASYGKGGAIGYWSALSGTSLITISALATLFAGQNSLGSIFLAGLLLSLVGYILLGIASLRSKSLPLWGSLALIFGFPLSVFLSSFGGGIVFGLTWLGIGYYLKTH